MTHKCPICGCWHAGDYQLCQKCIDKGEGKDYDYATDDYNYDAARERRAR